MAALGGTPKAPVMQAPPPQPLPSDQQIQNEANAAERLQYREGRASTFLADPTKDRNTKSAARTASSMLSGG